MQESDKEHDLFFKAGPFFILLSGVLLFQGYKGVWRSVDIEFISNNASYFGALSSMAVLWFIRIVESFIEKNKQSPSVPRKILTVFAFLVMLFLSGIGIANALYYFWVGNIVIEGGINKLTEKYDILASETNKITTTPVLDALRNEVQSARDRLRAEITSVNCGIGSGAGSAIEAIKKSLPKFEPMNIGAGTLTPCSNKEKLKAAADNYDAHIQKQLDADPRIVGERSNDRIALRNLIQVRQNEFNNMAVELKKKTNAASSTLSLFGPRDGYAGSVKSLIDLNGIFERDRRDAVQRASHLSLQYSSQVLTPVDLEQEKSLGNFRSLVLAFWNLNPWYILGFGFAAIAIDVVLIAWIYHTKTHVFPVRETILLGPAADRVRYLWMPLGADKGPRDE